MKQTKILIIGLALALLLLGFSLGYYITNRGVDTEISQIAAFASRSLTTDDEADEGTDPESDASESIIDDAGGEIESTVVVEADRPTASGVVMSENQNTNTSDQSLRLSGTWQLATIGGETVAEDEYILFVKAGERFGGETPCNAFYGAYDVVVGEIRTERFGSTSRECGLLESRVRESLKGGVFEAGTAGRLVVRGAGQELVFTR